jgi:hypothetical protein
LGRRSMVCFGRKGAKLRVGVSWGRFILVDCEELWGRVADVGVEF